MAKIVFISGATAGFGKACALRFAKEGYDVIITGRRKERLDELKKIIESSFPQKALALCFDVQKRKQVFKHINNMPEDWKRINILINNAGLAAGRDLFDEADIDDWDAMIDTNVKGLLYVSKAVIPFLIAGKNGHIINMGSIAGKEVYERGNAYCASKFAVDAISKSMRLDLLRHQVRVTNISPGAAETEFSLVRFKGDEEKANAMYKGYKPLTAEDIAELCFYVTSLPSHVCINELEVTCLAQANTYTTFKSH
ncbi:MAG: SDR family NAD(P)-dependent oxidoreductase [Sphingobacteriales bacterium]|nr:SDR family NAD(P)-dependent oxidoreductase [Sphingobacteriales bacterium]MBI3718726.1 SDR family NAD(P)-dependent oxidoreductase [Sphingobacteriales bacterium]